MIKNELSIRPITDSDIPLLEGWLLQNRIKEWYEIPNICTIQDWLDEIHKRHTDFSFISHFIAYKGEIPIGFAQYYPCDQAREEWYQAYPLIGTYSIDYLIGEASFLGKGYGKELISLLIEKIFSKEDAQRIVVQPDAKNLASNRVLQANGFNYDSVNHLYLFTKN
ncbi:GNAT family N-acetyltransferase [Listeria monocytogenes]|uniref:GNAT family N-acetyltransferase n=2 Tax=Listeria monocytogenes TaxID=1639 RepID=A0A823FV26_LISMN|nr:MULTISPECIES: GNAT family N-acetyltransferase [Bacilli]EAE3706361.1 GNAT family N-acetyltransferase [Listeria monocytogenes serotype 1/2b]ANE39603.1 hypothetical protein AAV53_10430 [Listeria monocytogenes]AQP80014.1 N-acetyltransferase [Listeria monocytogenes]EAC2470314.1 GNAT family N-acetyltransferase [Listeria monocytogenes]EAC2470524.1 GNAT family N-acetyltransferase [Listeria monocytogenes]